MDWLGLSVKARSMSAHLIPIDQAFSRAVVRLLETLITFSIIPSIARYFRKRAKYVHVFDTYAPKYKVFGIDLIWLFPRYTS